jgi:hypothetical protein
VCKPVSFGPVLNKACHITLALDFSITVLPCHLRYVTLQLLEIFILLPASHTSRLGSFPVPQRDKRMFPVRLLVTNLSLEAESIDFSSIAPTSQAQHQLLKHNINFSSTVSTSQAQHQLLKHRIEFSSTTTTLTLASTASRLWCSPHETSDPKHFNSTTRES